MTRVLHIITGLGVGGAEATLITLTKALAAQGIEQRVIALSGGPNAEILTANGIPVDVLEARGLHLLPAAFRLASITRSFRPDVVQGWMYHGDIAALMTRPLLKADARVIWGIRASDMDLTRYGRLLSVCARLSRFPDMVLANSRAGADAHVARGYRAKAMDVIPNGIDVARFRPDHDVRVARREALGLPTSALVVAHVARVDPMKDHATLLSAAALVPDIHFLIAGAGTEALDLPSNVRALGRITDPEALFAAADIVVSSSAFGEGFPNVIAEGMAAGCAPIATRCGDVELIIGDTGDIVPIKAPEALANAIKAFAALAPETQSARKLSARERIVSTLALDRMVERYSALYRLNKPSLGR